MKPLYARALPIALLLLLAPTPVSIGAASAEAARWSRHTVTYRDGSSYRTEVAAAVAAWNALPVRLRLVPAGPGRRAMINVRDGSLPGSIAGVGGFPPDGSVTLDRGLDRDGPTPLASVAGEVAAHEIGHALGLPHTRRCSLMEPVALLAQACSAPSGYARCGPQRLDARRLARRYGWAASKGGRSALTRAHFGLCADGTPVPDPTPDDPTAPLPEPTPAAPCDEWDGNCPPHDDDWTCETSPDGSTVTCTGSNSWSSSTECTTGPDGETTCTTCETDEYGQTECTTSGRSAARRAARRIR